MSSNLDEQARKILEPWALTRENRDPIFGGGMTLEEYTWLKEHPNSTRFDYEAQRNVHR